MTDGVDHINVYSKGATRLGRWLSNFTPCKLITEDGEFASIEGYWYWLGCTHPDRDRLRTAYGFRAKQLGRELRADDWPSTPDFRDKIKAAIEYKVNNNPEMKKILLDNKLPLRHYYVYCGKIVEVKEAEWILDIIRNIR